MSNEPNPLSDQIHIEQLEISTRIGVPEKERATPQRLTVSISFWPYYDQRDMADEIDNTVNYSIVAEETKNFVRDQSTNLIETLADRLATHLVKTFRIQKVTVELIRLLRLATLSTRYCWLDRACCRSRSDANHNRKRAAANRKRIGSDREGDRIWQIQMGSITRGCTHEH
jgi:dihydroneopterin aldolase